jgi:type IV secretion system protein VirB4
MMTIRAIRRDHHACGALNALLAPWAFVDDHAFLTKGGQLGLVYRVRGVDYECLDHVHRQDVVRRYEGALRLLDERYQVYQYLFKRRIDSLFAAPCSSPVASQAIQRRTAYLNNRRGDLYEIDLYLVLLYRGIRSRATQVPKFPRAWRSPLRSVGDWLSSSHATRVVAQELDQALTELQHQAMAFEVQTADTLRPVRLTKDEAFLFLRRLGKMETHRNRESTVKKVRELV